MKTILLTLTALIISSFSARAEDISEEFPYESKFLDVHGSKMHYIEEYADDSNPDQTTFLFLHGNPTSNYLWRNIISYVKGEGRALAPDLIGMGKSDKPDIKYTYKDHIKYLDEFLRQKNMRNVVLVLHDWGSAIGFHYAHRFQDKIKGIIFMEAVTKPIVKEESSFIQKMVFNKIRDDEKGYKMIVEDNYFVEKFIVKMGTKRKLTEKEKEYYAAPFKTLASRKPMQVFVKEIPFEGPSHHNYEIINAYSQWLKQTSIPKLLLYAEPGMLIKKKDVVRIKNEMKNLDAVYVGKGVHYIQEDVPHEIGRAIKAWAKKLNKEKD